MYLGTTPACRNAYMLEAVPAKADTSACRHGLAWGAPFQERMTSKLNKKGEEWFMEDPKERLTTSISTAELERRWKAIREMMREHKIDFLLMRQDEEFLGGYVKWFTDLSARHSYPFTVIFPIDEEMTIINCGAFPPGEPSFPPPWAVRG